MKRNRGSLLSMLATCLVCTILFTVCNNRIDSLSDLVLSDIELIVDGFFFTEGPAWHPDGYLLFSDLQLNRIHRWSDTGGVEIWREPSSYANGLAFDLEGRLLVCEGSNRRVTRTEHNGSRTVLVHSYDGKRLNTPNDLVLRSDGIVFFTDPVWALLLLGPDLDFKGVYMLKPDDDPVLLVNDMEEPNGIGLSPDEKTLYVVDTKRKHVRAFSLEADDSLSGGEVFVENIPSADGMTTDSKGYVYITGHDGVTVCDQKGVRLGLIDTPQPAANCTFGGPDFKTLFITASKGLYRIRMKFPGRAVKR